jgi:DNA-directed RNA polymerase specialized sigma24 family protein
MGLSAKDAALVLDKTVHAVKALQHRGLHNLRMRIQEMEARANEQP